jgi:hypothetical protein
MRNIVGYKGLTEVDVKCFMEVIPLLLQKVTHISGELIASIFKVEV